jgi:hypothetical protein
VEGFIWVEGYGFAVFAVFPDDWLSAEAARGGVGVDGVDLGVDVFHWMDLGEVACLAAGEGGPLSSIR